MLVNSIDEISALLPTNLVDDPNMLLTLTEDAEQDYLLPILGDELLSHLQDAYDEVVDRGGSVVLGMADESETTPEIRLIRLCQKPILYCAMANSVGILAVNLNAGGGLNVMENDNFEAADDKRLDRFAKDTWRNAQRGMDRILLFLEKDAKSERPVFAEMWRKSEAYYLHTELLFATADCMQRYCNVGSSRERFIQLVPDIRFCQETYLASQVGHELLSALIASETKPEVVPSEPVKAKMVWHRVNDMLRMALGVFVQNRIDKKKKMEEGDAMISLANAREYIRSNKACFGDLYKTTPMYDPGMEAVTDTKDGDMSDERLKRIFDPHDPDNAISTPFGYGINRH